MLDHLFATGCSATTASHPDDADFFEFLETSCIAQVCTPSTGRPPSHTSDCDDTRAFDVSPMPASALDAIHDHSAPVTPSTDPRSTKGATRRPRKNSAVLALSRRVRVKSVQRPITNNTYLRRLYLSSSHTRALFPTMARQLTLESNAKRPQKRAQTPLATSSFNLVTAVGLQWPARCECCLSSGKLHCRLLDGWATFCRDNDVKVGDVIELQQSHARSSNVVVAIKRAA